MGTNFVENVFVFQYILEQSQDGQPELSARAAARPTERAGSCRVCAIRGH